MRVRAAQPSDGPVLAEIFIRSFRTLDFLPTLHTDDEHRDFIRTLIDRGDVWIAELAGTIVGLTAVEGDVLGQLYVDPAARRQGVGTALLEKVKELRPNGFTFWVFQQNAGARRFYERHDCRLIRLTDGANNDEKTPDALYAWTPESSASSSMLARISRARSRSSESTITSRQPE